MLGIDCAQWFECDLGGGAVVFYFCFFLANSPGTATEGMKSKESGMRVRGRVNMECRKEVKRQRRRGRGVYGRFGTLGIISSCSSFLGVVSCFFFFSLSLSSKFPRVTLAPKRHPGRGSRG